MKKFLKFSLASLLLAIMIVPLAACDDDGTTKGGSAKGASDIEISDPEFGFVKAEDYDEETFDIATASKWSTLDVDAEYYLFITFDVTARRNNDGQSLLNVDFTFDALEILQGTMEDVSTGMIEEMTFRNAENGQLGKLTTISFKIPSLSSKPKTINMIVSLTPMKVGESHIIIGYRYDASSEYKLLGSDGYTKNLKIKAVKIQTPELSVSAMGWLQWTHVKNAEYYCIYEAGSQTPLTDFYGEPIYIVAEGYSVGSPMTFNIGEFLIGYHPIVIRAFNSSANIDNSDNSNIVEYTW